MNVNETNATLFFKILITRAQEKKPTIIQTRSQELVFLQSINKLTRAQMKPAITQARSEEIAFLRSINKLTRAQMKPAITQARSEEIVFL